MPRSLNRFDRFHVVARRHLARAASSLPAGAWVTVIGSLCAEAVDMPDRTVEYRTEILADELTPLGRDDGHRRCSPADQPDLP